MEKMTPYFISKKLSAMIISYNPILTEKKDHIRYGLEWIFSAIYQVFLVLLLSIPLNIWKESLLILLSGALLRMFSGGSHFKGYYTCLIFSTIQIITIAILINKFHYLISPFHSLLMVLLVMSGLIIIIKAPQLYKKKALFNRNKVKQLKYLSIGTFMFLLIISLYMNDFTYYIWLAIVFQSFSLTNIYNKVVLIFNK